LQALVLIDAQFHTRHVDADKVNPAKQIGTAVSKEDAKQDGEQAAEHLRTLCASLCSRRLRQR
jgi:hypothetical protein